MQNLGFAYELCMFLILKTACYRFQSTRFCFGMGH